MSLRTRWFLNSFRPICRTVIGRSNCANDPNLPPYADASCRREPDLEHSAPAITCLCRGDKFAPRLNEGDRVIYLTVKSRYPGAHDRCWGLVAALTIVEVFESHDEGARWYTERGLHLPTNCLVGDTQPKPLEATEGLPSSIRSLEAWDRYYRAKARKWPRFVVTTPELVELRTPAIVYARDLVKIFGRVPGTRNPCGITANEYDALLRLAGVAPNGTLRGPLVRDSRR